MVAVLVTAALALPARPALAGDPLTMTNFKPASGPVGTPVGITGTGFVAGDVVTFNGTPASVVKVNPTGTHISTVVPPLASSGPLVVTNPATGQSVGLPGRSFLVTRGIWSSLDTAFAGQSFVVAGSDLSPDVVEQVELSGEVLARGVTDAFGDFSLTFTVPWTTLPGPQQLGVVDPRIGTLLRPLTVLSSWPQLSATSTRSGANLADVSIGPSNVATLTQKFEKTFGNIVLDGAPIVAGGLVYVNDKSTLVASDATTGHTTWTFPTGDTIYTTPAVADGIVYDASTDGNLYALDAKTGHFLWAYRTCNSAECDANAAPITVANGVALVPSEAGFLFALDATTGAFLWAATEGDASDNGVAVANGVVYLGNDLFVHALKLKTGALLWNDSCVDASPPTYANGIVYDECWESPNLVVHGLNANTGSVLETLTVEAYGNMSVAGGLLYFNARTSLHDASLIAMTPT